MNLGSPNPATNAQFVKALGRALHRPTVFPFPGFAVDDGVRRDGRDGAPRGPAPPPRPAAGRRLHVRPPRSRRGARARARAVARLPRARPRDARLGRCLGGRLRAASRERARARARAVPHRGGVRRPDRGRRDTRPATGPGQARPAISAELPVVGDWVAVEPRRPRLRRSDAVLPRRTKFSRRAAHDPGLGRHPRAGRGRERRRRLHRRLARRRPQPAAVSSATSRSPGRAAPGPSSCSRRPISSRIPRARRDRVGDRRRRARPRDLGPGEDPASTRSTLPLARRHHRAPRARPAPASRRSSTRWQARSVLTTGAVATTARAATRRRGVSWCSFPAAVSSSTTRGCASSTSGSPTTGSRTRSRTSSSSRRSASSRTAGTRASPGCAVQEALADGVARPRALGELPRAPAGARRARGTSRRVASAPAPGVEGRTREAS